MPVAHEAKTPRRRVVMLIALCVVMCISAALRTFQYQIVDGETYLAAAQRGTEATQIAQATGSIGLTLSFDLPQTKIATACRLRRIRPRSTWRSTFFPWSGRAALFWTTTRQTH